MQKTKNNSYSEGGFTITNVTVGWSTRSSSYLNRKFLEMSFNDFAHSVNDLNEDF